MTIYRDTLHWPDISLNRDIVTEQDLITGFDLITRFKEISFATGAASQKRTLTHPDTWSCPTLGLASVLILRPFSPRTCYCKRGYFRWGKISRKCWQDISRGGNFHDTTHISFIKACGFYFRVGVTFAMKAKARKARKLPPRENFHVYSMFPDFEFRTSLGTSILLFTSKN